MGTSPRVTITMGTRTGATMITADTSMRGTATIAVIPTVLMATRMARANVGW